MCSRTRADVWNGLHAPRNKAVGRQERNTMLKLPQQLGVGLINAASLTTTASVCITSIRRSIVTNIAGLT